jgi:uncharacterized membrane protein
MTDQPRVEVQPSESRGATRSRLALAALMVSSGITHFVAPAAYERIVPRWAGDARRVVRVSGAAEIACGVLLSSRRAGKVGGWLTAALLVAVFPANMPAGRFRAIALGRLPLQLPLVGWALRVARGR